MTNNYSNNEKWLSRTMYLFSNEQMLKIKNSHVMLFGIGGVGGHALDALARTGVGKISIVDNDCFDVSNINRQIYANLLSVGKPKVDVAKERLLTINPEVQVDTYKHFYTPESRLELPEDVDCVIDAIDHVKGKICLIKDCNDRGVPIVSSMGMGNRCDPTKIKIGDIFETTNDPLARKIRKELRNYGIKKLRCVYSSEIPKLSKDELGNVVTASVSYVPCVAGIYMAYDTIENIISL